MSVLTSLRSRTMNPVLRRELVERWRGRRAFLVISAYIALLSLVTMLLYWIGSEFLEDRMRWGGFQALAAGPTVGRFLFENILAFVLLLVLFIAPGYAAAQISGERERRTLALLQITLVRPSQIVAGKLAASVAWLLLLVVAALPVGAVAFFLGGVSLPDLLRGLVTLIVAAVSVSAISLGISSLTRKTTASVVLTYAVVMVLILGTLFASLVEVAAREFRGRGFDESMRPVALYANPFYGMADAVRSNSGVSNDLPSVLTAFGFALPQPGPRAFDAVVEAEMVVEPRPGVGVDGGIRDVQVLPEVGQPALDRQERRRPVWLITSGIYVLLGAAGFALATRRVHADRGPLRRRKPPKDDDRQLGDAVAAAGQPFVNGATLGEAGASDPVTTRPPDTGADR